MRTVGISLCIVILTACAGTPMESGPGAPTVPDSASIPNDTQPVERTAYTSAKRDCDLTRAIDGYVVCAPEVKTTPHGTEPARDDRALNVPLEAARLTAQSVPFEPVRNQPGQYLVIGSFNDRDNALRWAEFNAEFGTEIYAARDAAHQWYRVVVGPLDEADSPTILREIFAAVGLTGSWRMAICGSSAVSGDCPDLDSAHLALVAEI